MNLLEAMTGKETFDTGNCTVQVWACPDSVFNTFKAEMAIDAAARKSEIPLERHSFAGRELAWLNGSRPDLGYWNKAIYQVPDGMIFKVFAHRAAGHGERIMNVCQFIRTRPKAAYREIRIALTGHEKARFQYAIIKGRFDLLTMEQAQKRGVKIDNRFRHTFNEKDVARVMEFILLEDEKESAAIVRERVIRRKGSDDIVLQKKRKVRAFDLSE